MSLTILCIADHQDPLVYSAAVKERFRDVDLVLSAGDLHLEFYNFLISTLNKPLCFVFGNHQLKHLPLFRREYREHGTERPEPGTVPPGAGALYAGGRNIRIKGLLLAGLGGSYRYNDGQNQFTEVGMFLYALRLLPGLLWNRLRYGRYLDILLTHSPPYGCNDRRDRCHRGFKTFRLLMRLFKPRYLIHGHVHLYNANAERESRYGGTRVINAYNHTLIKWEATT